MERPDLESLRERWRVHAKETMAAQVFEEGLQHWHHPKGDIAFCDTRSAWVVCASPIAASENLSEVSDVFAEEAKSQGRRVRYFGCETAPPGYSAVLIGEEGIWRNDDWHDTKRTHKSLREQLRRARAKGVQCSPILKAQLAQPKLQQEIETLLQAWQRSRPMPPMGFAVRLDPFCNLDNKLVLAARQGEQLVGLLVAVLLPATKTCFIEDLLRHPGAPNGTNESLIDACFEHARAQGTECTSLGLAPLSGPVPKTLALIREVSRPLFDFSGLRAFKEKLRPHRWQSLHLAYPQKSSPVLAIFDLLRAFAGGSFLGFAARLIAHQTSLLLWIMTWLLLPWIALLASPSASYWFPSTAVQGAWVSFDLALFVLLLHCSLSPRQKLLGLAAFACAVDLSLGCLQWFLHTRHTIDHAAEAAIAVLALLAPLFALGILLLRLRLAPTLYWRWRDL